MNTYNKINTDVVTMDNDFNIQYLILDAMNEAEVRCFEQDLYAMQESLSDRIPELIKKAEEKIKKICRNALEFILDFFKNRKIDLLVKNIKTIQADGDIVIKVPYKEFTADDLLVKEVLSKLAKILVDARKSGDFTEIDKILSRYNHKLECEYRIKGSNAIKLIEDLKNPNVFKNGLEYYSKALQKFDGFSNALPKNDNLSQPDSDVSKQISNRIRYAFLGTRVIIKILQLQYQLYLQIKKREKKADNTLSDITKGLIDSNSTNIRKLRLALKDYIQLSYINNGDFRYFDAMCKYAELKNSKLWDKDDNIEFDMNKSHWNKKLYAHVLLGSLENFTKKRINYLKKLCRYLFNYKMPLIDKKD